MTTERRNLIAAISLTLAGFVLMFVLTAVVANLWYRLALFYVAMIPAAHLAVQLDWKSIFKVKLKHLELGLLAGVLLYVIGWVGVRLIQTLLPEVAADIDVTYGLLDSAPGWQVWPLLFWVITGEEIVFRLAVTLGFTDKLKLWGVALGAGSFALVHIPWGPPLLLVAALVFGGCWSLIAYKTRSFWAAFVAHVSWDLLVMFALPYA
ncbi:MAG: CPBP family intramembrane metalloprotease [Planctomycetes bacterium]|nr:CPBP family intramembrane metalloprotease [Planctomycetota bacterium]